MDIHRAENGISLSQKPYINSVLERYKMSASNPVGRHIVSKCEELEVDDKFLARNVSFREAVGSLMYITNMMPDICCALSCT